METITLIFFIILAIFISGILTRVIPFNIPLPLVQIFFGGVISFFFDKGVPLEPHMFFLIFIPPLLFLDGWQISNFELKKEWFNIFQLSVGLVVFTMVVLGFLINFLIPGIPLAIAFALAAILSPTDPVAVSGIAGKLPVSKRVMSVLEGEALFNDATGLVAFKMAILVAVTGTFSTTEAVGSFIWVVSVGVITGILTTWILYLSRKKVIQKYGEELGSEVMLSLLIPFVSYLVAERLHASGVLSAVASGITMSRLELRESANPMTRMRRTAIWDTAKFILNGAIFVILGEQLPNIFKNSIVVASEYGYHNVFDVIFLALFICFILIFIRFFWVVISLNLTFFIKHKYRLVLNDENLRDIFLVSLGGVRGTVTLAGVLSFPLLLPSGSTFPARDLTILLAATVIIISIIVASVFIPMIVKDKVESKKQSGHDFKISKLVIELSRSKSEESLSDLYVQFKEIDSSLGEEEYLELVNRLWLEIEESLNLGENSEGSHSHKIIIEKKVRKSIIEATRKSIYTLAIKRDISDVEARDMVRRLDFYDVGFNNVK
ncbi:Na+/H+ antiporter [Shewanella algae]|uniref:Na+/H+ antiporter n=1 Tax=Shewanella algae TaxID=38313 RepID=UPI001AAEDBD5|nr:Na+/H+ antiporter [Shewanella algae]MBO2583519.1 Na+/H+ antiporter [Shewanella algae]